jgi:hypothetical protein
MSAYSPAARATTAARAAGSPLGLWSWAGALFVVLFMAGLVVSETGSGAFPSPFSAGAAIQKFFAENHDTMLLLAVLEAFASFALLALAAALAAYARRAAGQDSPLPAMTLASGVLAAAFLLVPALLQWTLVRPHTLAEPGLVRVLHDLAFLAGGPAHVAALGLMIGSAAAAGRRAAMPAWLSTVGLAVAAISVLSLLALVVQPVLYLLAVGRFVGFAWILVASFVVARRA